MATAGKPKIKNYGRDFKPRAVQRSHQPGVETQKAILSYIAER